jgi:hypothetical protein
VTGNLRRLTVHLLIEDARTLAAMPRDERPLDGEIATPVEIVVVPAHAAEIDGLVVGEGTAFVTDLLGDRVLAVIREDDYGEFLAGCVPELTEQRRARLRA